ncbi:hypothetical protein [Celeribacter sp.]|uniref:hypothetical protein n=1 Tax=Celeribacter sp. TaxID=1890673 RepID=UPI003A8EC482
MTTQDFTPPPRARQHCRHYSYELGHGWPLGEGSGPRCAVGVNMDDGGASEPCMPNPAGWCPKREEWTEEERAAWETWAKDSRARIATIFAALPRQIEVNTTDSMTCPACGGSLRYGRWRGGAQVHCESSHCCSVRVNVDESKGWPA